LPTRLPGAPDKDYPVHQVRQVSGPARVNLRPVTGQTAATFQIPITIPSTTEAGTYNLTVTNPDGSKGAKAITVTRATPAR
jgi:hypothetical protein